MLGSNGGLIGVRRTTSNSSAVGVWTLNEQVITRRILLWPGSWTPASLSTALWLDADTGGSITLTSGAVSQWSDRSDNSRHATQGTAGERPTVNATGINNKPAISFDGSDDWLALPSGFLNGTTAFTIAMVIAAPLQQNDAVFGPSSSFSTGLELVCTNTASQPTLLRVNNSNRIISGLWSTNSAPALTTITASSTATAGWLNGTAVSAASSAGISALNFNGIYGLGRYNGSFNAQMLVGEFIILESSASTDDRQKLEGYLAHKWGLTANLPADHPYKTVAP